MDIILNTTEMHEAVTNYVNTKGMSTRNCDVDIKFRNTRSGEGGVTAEVSITPVIKQRDLTSEETDSDQAEPEGDAHTQSSLFPSGQEA